MAKSLQSIFDKAVALKERGKLLEAIDLYRKAVKLFPDSGVAEHNLAGALGDAGRWNEAEAHVRRAFKKGLDAPQTWLVFARTLMSLGKIDEAREAFEKTLQLNPAVLDAQRELAQLVWMATGDSKSALERLDATIASFPDAAVLHHIKAQALRAMEGHARTLEFVSSSLERWPEDVALLVSAVDAAIHTGETDAALELSQRVMALDPNSQSALESRITALLAAGRADEALPMVEHQVAASPNDQHAIALLATTCRLLGDERYAQLHNYDDFVRPYELTTPKGWSSLDEYLDDLRTALAERHPYKRHPFMNSLDGGSMIMDFASMDNKAIGSLLQALTPAIDAHVDYLGKGDDAVRSRNTGRWQLDGIWSVYLQPNGFHHDHVHPNGWLSSACYITLPDRLETEEKEGWIKFGEPGVVTEPKLPWEHAVKPQVGTIVLFPSYMWHGTIPFGGDQRRMTCALDIVPA
jgi:tetratricopeptide (TPR) repeat protein